MPFQSTDAANSAPMISAKNVDGSGKPKITVSRSVQAIATDDGASVGTSQNTDPITAPLAAGDT